jgi:hypothetical protein
VTSHLQKSKKREVASRFKAAIWLYYGRLRCEMAKQSHLKIGLQVALVNQFRISDFSIRIPQSPIRNPVATHRSSEEIEENRKNEETERDGRTESLEDSASAIGSRSGAIGTESGGA